MTRRRRRIILAIASAVALIWLVVPAITGDYGRIASALTGDAAARASADDLATTLRGSPTPTGVEVEFTSALDGERTVVLRVRVATSDADDLAAVSRTVSAAVTGGRFAATSVQLIATADDRSSLAQTHYTEDDAALLTRWSTLRVATGVPFSLTLTVGPPEISTESAPGAVAAALRSARTEVVDLAVAGAAWDLPGACGASADPRMRAVVVEIGLTVAGCG